MPCRLPGNAAIMPAPMNKSHFAALVLLSLASCKPHTSSVVTSEGAFTLKSHEITYRIPYQKSASVDDSGGDYVYTGDTLSFAVKSGQLSVNGKDAGTVKAGDTVDIDKAGAVSINGTPQAPK
jgi:hypothetical protein